MTWLPSVCTFRQVFLAIGRQAWLCVLSGGGRVRLAGWDAGRACRGGRRARRWPRARAAWPCWWRRGHRRSACVPRWRPRAATAGFTLVAGPPGRWRLVAGELGDCFLGAGIIDQVLAGGCGGDERRDGGVVQGSGQAVGDAVQPGGRVVGEQGFFAPGELEVMAQAGGGFGKVHRLDREPGGDPLAEG